MTMIDRTVGALGRISMSVVFLVRGLNQIFDWRAADQEVSMALMDWRGTLEGFGIGSGLLDFVYQHTYFLIAFAVFGEICGAISLLFGFRVRIGTFLLILVWIPMVIFQHPFWLLDGVQREQELMGFLLNLAVLGGLFSLFSLIGWRRRYDRPMARFRGDD